MTHLITASCNLKTCGVLFRRLAIGAAFCAGLVDPASAAMTVGELRCEYAFNPIGIDTREPRLSWTLLDNERGQRQSAYQIRVADTPKDLETEKNLLWDSGKVVSDQNTHVVYAGKKLRSGSRYYWKVRAWDKQDQPSPWSDPALWQVALLDSTDWNRADAGSTRPAQAATTSTCGRSTTLSVQICCSARAS